MSHNDPINDIPTSDVSLNAERAEKCEDCGTLTDRWVRGWDGRFRCMAHAANGRLGAKPHHCPTCTCVNPSVSTRPGSADTP